MENKIDFNNYNEAKIRQVFFKFAELLDDYNVSEDEAKTIKSMVNDLIDFADTKICKDTLSLFAYA